MKVWTVAKLNKDNVSALAERLGLSPVICALLYIRGFDTVEKAEKFLCDDSIVDNPFDIADMDKAADRVRKAVESGERICVYGDYDADGVTATALLYSYLEALGADVIYYIPDREAEGYGIHISAIDVLREKGVQLVVTVDTGISAVEEIAYAKSLGIDTVVTDHHMPGEVLPEAYAVVDLHRVDCPSRFKLISGVGVAFKLVMAIEGEYADVEMLLDNYSDLLCLGTIGDIVELIDENRVFVKRGLESINNGDRAGVRALKNAAGIDGKDITAGNVSFTLVPRINAVGRLGQSRDSVSLLLTEDENEAAEIASKLSDDNAERQRIEKEILSDINKIVAKNPSLVQDRVIIIDGEGWKKGVVGIVSARIKEIYGKPCIVIARDGECASGSGRSVEGFDLWSAVNSCSDMLDHFGGHTMACGLGLRSDKIDDFRARINKYAARLDMPFNMLNIDLKLKPAAVDIEIARQLSVLEPFGSGNNVPVFQLSNLKLNNITPVKNNTHLRLTFFAGGKYITAMLFRTSTNDFNYKIGDVVDIAVTFSINEFKNGEYLSIIIRDMKYSDADNREYIASERIFERFCKGENLSGEELGSIIPDRKDFAEVYRCVSKLKNTDNLRLDVLKHSLSDNISYGKLRVILEAMNDLGLIAIYEDLKKCSIKLLEVGRKVNLEDADIIKSLKEVEV